MNPYFAGKKLSDTQRQIATIDDDVKSTNRGFGTRVEQGSSLGDDLALRRALRVPGSLRAPQRHRAHPRQQRPLKRYRLNRGNNRRLNHAIHVIALTQAGYDPRARAFLARSRAEGKSSREAMRALKRRLSDVLYRQLLADAARQPHLLDKT
jgi:hypothetical protein